MSKRKKRRRKPITLKQHGEPTQYDRSLQRLLNVEATVCVITLRRDGDCGGLITCVSGREMVGNHVAWRYMADYCLAQAAGDAQGVPMGPLPPTAPVGAGRN